MSQKVALFGGSFDPIHNGHLKMADELANIENLQTVWFCPARMNPHKIGLQPAPIEHRLKMTSLAIADNPRFSLLDVEARRQGLSYTIDTVKWLVKREEERKIQRKIFLIVSEEVFPGFLDWKDSLEIIQLVPLLVGRRDLFSTKPPKIPGQPEINAAIKKGWRETRPLNISSTDIRQKIQKGVSCQGLVPAKVLDYIYQNHLYYKV